MIAISTAFKNALVAIDIKGKQDFLQLKSDFHSEDILKSIDEILEKNNLSISDNDSFALVIGPGSFTGLRIGASLVKGLCAGSKNDCLVVPISSFQLIAQEYLNSKPKGDFVCLLNALSGLVFACDFDKNGHMIGSERLVKIEEIDKKSQTVGIEEENVAKKRVKLTCQRLLEVANRLLSEGKTTDYRKLQPTYLRKSQAEDSLEKKELKKY